MLTLLYRIIGFSVGRFAIGSFIPGVILALNYLISSLAIILVFLVVNGSPFLFFRWLTMEGVWCAERLGSTHYLLFLKVARNPQLII